MLENSFMFCNSHSSTFETLNLLDLKNPAPEVIPHSHVVQHQWSRHPTTQRNNVLCFFVAEGQTEDTPSRL